MFPTSVIHWVLCKAVHIWCILSFYTGTDENVLDEVSKQYSG